MKIKLNTGIEVRTGPTNADGSVPTRRLGEAGDVIDSDDVTEWDGTIPAWLVEDGFIELIEDGAKPAADPVVIAED